MQISVNNDNVIKHLQGGRFLLAVKSEDFSDHMAVFSEGPDIV